MCPEIEVRKLLLRSIDGTDKYPRHRTVMSALGHMD
jgi:hypothetical protein